MHPRPYIIVILIFIFGLVPQFAGAASKVGGSLLYGAGASRTEVDGEEVSRIKSQYGQASLFTESQGLIVSERLGGYSLMLGYEFNIIDPTIINAGVRDPEAQRIEAEKLLYQGAFTLAPGGLPFRISGYARDVKRSTFTTGLNQPSLSFGSQSGWDDRGINNEILTDINNGTQKELGFTVLLGIRNGSYLGSYRDVLSQLPRLLIDYKQTEVEDLSRDSDMEHYRERDLAFISLNKLNNWIHLRKHDYVDYLDETQNFDTTQLMIGTIDHNLSRQWINLTNWIRISTDLSYTTEKWRYEELPENTHNLNLFVVAQRTNSKVSALTTFERTTQDELLKQSLDIPVYFSYTPNRDSLYRGNLRGQQWTQSLFGTATAENTFWQQQHRSASFSLNTELNRSRAVVFKPGINIEARENIASQGLSEKLTLEWSKKQNLEPLSWTAGYYVASTQTSSDAEAATAVYVEQSLYGNMEKNLNRALRAGLRTRIRYGSGSSENSVTDDVTDSVNIATIIDGQIKKGDVDSFVAYYGQVFLEHTGGSISNRIEFSADGINTDVDSKRLIEVEHVLKVEGRTSELTLSSTLVHGTEITVRSVDLDYVEEVQSQGSDFGWSSKARYTYDPDRRLRMTLLGSARGVYGGEENITSWVGSEKLEYRFYSTRGRVRKLAEVFEEFGVEQTSQGLSGRDRALFLRLAGSIFPTDYFYAKITSELLMFAPSDSMQMSGAAETGLNYDKLQIALSYGRGYKEAEGLLAKAMEERWNLRVKKIF